MPIKTFCDLCDKEITETKGTQVKSWIVQINSPQENEFNQDTMNKEDGAGKYRGQMPIGVNHSYVCKDCVLVVRRAMYYLTPEYTNTLPTGD